MTRLTWGQHSSRIFEAGIDRGVFYPQSGPGIAWNGLVSVKESVDDATQTLTYFDGDAVWNQITLGTFQATLSAITYPIEFEPYDGYSSHLAFGQPRKTFGFCYRTLVGDAVDGLSKGYKLHLVYNALASPSEVHHVSITGDTTISAFGWDISTVPVNVDGVMPLDGGGVRPSAHIVIDSTVVNAGVMAAVEDLLYGNSEGGQPVMPTPRQLLDLFEPFALFRITDHGDGTFTASGPDDAVFMTSATEFQMSWPSIVMISDDTYVASSF